MFPSRNLMEWWLLVAMMNWYLKYISRSSILFRFPNTQKFSFNYGHQLLNRGKLPSFCNEISHQFYLYFYDEQMYDNVVGDTTILANRSLYVDFTLPYTKFGISTIMPIIDNRSKNAWVLNMSICYSLKKIKRDEGFPMKRLDPLTIDIRVLYSTN